jgi:hypothetical protein
MYPPTDAAMAEDGLTEPPFPPSAQLNDQLEYNTKEGVLNRPLVANNRLVLPGYPQLELYDTSAILDHCVEDLTTGKFDALARKHMRSLHFNGEPILSFTKNLALGRKIVVTEESGLHCTWDDDFLFIKPIPAYLTSHAFWLFLLSSPEKANIIPSANGLLRSYTHLIKHESDYHMAVSHHLIPSCASYEDLIIFLNCFRPLPDSAVSLRHHFGLLQLHTLNYVSFFNMMKPYHRLHRNRYNAFFLRYYGPTLFIFATFSVALSAMQVALAVRAGKAATEGVAEGGLGGSWR